MKTYVLEENVLTDDLLIVPDEGKIFDGGYIAIIKIYVFQSSWSDRETIKRFRSEKSLNKYLQKNYSEFEFY